MATASVTMKLAERHGSVLSGRIFAAELAEEVLSQAEENGVVVFDFAGVETVSPSFADELFGKLVVRVGPDRVRFENLSPHLQAVSQLARLGRERS